MSETSKHFAEENRGRVPEASPDPDGKADEVHGHSQPVHSTRAKVVSGENVQSAAKKESEEPNESKPASVEAQLAEAQSEMAKFKELALRSAADLDNYRKRMAREREEAIKFANASFLERLIPVLDNFELGLTAARASGGSALILDGMTMVQKQLQDFLTNSGVESIDATGLRFDPNLHEAIAQETSDEVAEGSVVRQVRKGYKLRDRLIRPANVVVSKGALAMAEAKETP